MNESQSEPATPKPAERQTGPNKSLDTGKPPQEYQGVHAHLWRINKADDPTLQASIEQIRVLVTIKRILIWMLIIVPVVCAAIAITMIAVESNAGASGSRCFSSSYC